MDLILYIPSGVFMLLLIIIVIMFCCKCSSKRRERTEEQIRIIGKSTESLIPPIFYTNDIKDPLMQEDLHDKVNH